MTANMLLCTCIDVKHIERMILTNFWRRICLAWLLFGLDPGDILLIRTINLSIVLFVLAFCQ